jgi:hypothetical protein
MWGRAQRLAAATMITAFRERLPNSTGVCEIVQESDFIRCTSDRVMMARRSEFYTLCLDIPDSQREGHSRTKDAGRFLCTSPRPAQTCLDANDNHLLHQQNPVVESLSLVGARGDQWDSDYYLALKTERLPPPVSNLIMGARTSHR